MKLFKKLRALIIDPERDLKERVFVLLTLLAIVTAAFALIGDVIYQENIVEIIALIGTVVMVPFLTLFAVRTGKIDLSARFLSFAIVFAIMPVVYIFGGGINGGGIPWLIFSYLYIGLVLYGVWRMVMIFALTGMVIFLFVMNYYHPELIRQHSPEIVLLDVALAVIEVGFVCFIMTWFQNRLFMAENRRAKEETKKVEDLNNAQNRFFSSMSHEIRTPINSILGLNEIILRQPDASEEILKDAGNIQGAGRMLLALINDILDFSKIEAGKMDIVPVNYSLSSLVSEIVNMLWLRAQQKGLEFKVEIDPSIPAELYGDEVRIKQILVNLLNNAVKYTPEGSVTLHIEKEDMQGDQVVLTFSVIDTGMGIKQSAIPYLFDVFKREDEEKNSRIEGTGLGLSIVKQLVNLMGGRITVNSVYTQGSSFVVTLWQKVTRADALGEIDITNSQMTVKAEGYKAGFSAPDARILIVDDNEMNLEVEKKLLKDTGMTIDTAISGMAALELTALHTYDLIFMDHLMPVMDGIECLNFIRTQEASANNRVPVVVLTANAAGENRDLYARSGFEDVLVKPVSGRQMESMLLAHLPENKVLVQEGSELQIFSMNTARGYSRRIPIQIATGSMCDLPRALLRKHMIDSIPFKLISEGRIFYDGVEAQADELLRYLKEGVVFETEPPSVEEFERFFANELKKAHNVIYVAMAATVTKEYENARTAARAYGNVRVINSGQGSSAVGLLALLAQRMASHGDTPERILEKLAKTSEQMHVSFAADTTFFARNKDVSGGRLADLMKTFSIHPVIRVHNGTYGLARLFAGEMEHCFRKYVDYSLHRRAKPDLDLLIVAYSDLTEEQLLRVIERVRRRFEFAHIFFQKVSAILALNLGAGAVGLIYFEKNGESLHLSNMFVGEQRDDELEGEPLEQEEAVEEIVPELPVEPKEPEVPDDPETARLKSIEGVDYQIAMENNGSNDLLMTVLKLFYESVEPKAEELQKLYDTEDWENYTIKVHALKSSARLIGGSKLADAAMDLEMAGKENNIAFIRENHDQMMSEYRDYLPRLEPLFDKEENKEEKAEEKVEEKAEAINEHFDEVLLENIYEALEDAIRYHDEDLINDVFSEAQEYEFPQKDKELLEKLKESFEQKDYAGMKETIRSRRE